MNKLIPYKVTFKNNNIVPLIIFVHNQVNQLEAVYRNLLHGDKSLTEVEDIVKI